MGFIQPSHFILFYFIGIIEFGSGRSHKKGLATARLGNRTRPFTLRLNDGMVSCNAVMISGLCKED